MFEDLKSKIAVLVQSYEEIMDDMVTCVLLSSENGKHWYDGKTFCPLDTEEDK